MGVSWLDLDMRSASISAAALVAVAVAVRPARRRWSDLLAAGAVEAALVCSLFALWQLADTGSHHHVNGGFVNGRRGWGAGGGGPVAGATRVQSLLLSRGGGG